MLDDVGFALVGGLTTVASGDTLGQTYYLGLDGTGYNSLGATESVVVDGTVSTGVVPGKYVLATSSSVGTLTDRFTVDAAGKVSVLATTEATTAGAGSLTTAGGIYAAKKIVTMTGLVCDATVTAGGTTGNQTINKPTGTVNIAAAGTTVTVTNALCTTSSIVFAVLRTNDATATIKNVVPAAGSFVINLTAAATAEVSIGFMIVN